MSAEMIICIAEDRKTCEPGVKVLVSSIVRNCPRLSIVLFYPPADDNFLSWSKRYPQLAIDTDSLPGLGSWNVKPHALQHLLNKGHDEVIWIDSDVVVTRDIFPIFHSLPSDVLVLAEEALGGGHHDPIGLKAQLWGFKVGRIFPFTFNTAVIRVTTEHYSLLQKWAELLGSDQYQHWQQLSPLWLSRRHVMPPFHLVSDQDVLTALLASVEYSHVPVRVLNRGKEIIQYFTLKGYTTVERIRNLFTGVPAFVHSQGRPKPWWVESAGDPWPQHRVRRKRPPNSVRNYVEAVYRDLSPYLLIARSYRHELEGVNSWMRPHMLLSAILRIAGLWYPPLVGFPIALAVDALRLANRAAWQIRSQQ
jgi:Nucleotide-diphospho-sugar transferase